MNETLKTLRRAKGWSQTRLARESGVSQTYISDLEAGRSNPTVPVLKRLAAALGVRVSDLIGEGEDRPEARTG
jgi:transcriptional regulator with XRE-family HTH domain